MKLQPIINAKLSRFRAAYGLEGVHEGTVFERFSNQMILTNHQPDAFSVADELLDAVCVGGPNDMGIDGLCIKLNGILIHLVQEAQDIIKLHHAADIEFIFIQSKYKEKFDYGEYVKFISGVLDFLSEDHFQPRNEKIEPWLEIKDYLLSESIMTCWKHNPNIRLYYIVMGTWTESPHICAATKKFKQDVDNLNTYEDASVKYVDTASFKSICDENENALTATINTIDMSFFQSVDCVSNSMIVVCNARELLKLLLSDDSILRKSLFDDNVRDYQGDTIINGEIYKTIKEAPQNFVLLNNGITIVCDEVTPSNRSIILHNPQIVNGCQTCNVIYAAYRDDIDVSQVVVTIKIIATRSNEITNSIVRGTNRQNIVYDEAFEVTREFHKELEEFFHALSVENPKIKMLYERRSKQYFEDPSLTPLEKVNFRIIIQSFVSIFLNEPHQGHHHEAILLKEYKNKIFIDAQSKFPYYIASAIYILIDKSIRSNIIPRNIRAYRMHLSWLFRELSCGESPSINDEKAIDAYCKKLLTILKDTEICDKWLQKAIEVLQQNQASWITEKGENYRSGMKDSAEFTSYIQKKITMHNQTKMQTGSDLQCRGTVIKINCDRYGKMYGFISKTPHNIFFHEHDNFKINFDHLLNKEVFYTPVIDEESGREKAKEVSLVSL